MYENVATTGVAPRWLRLAVGSAAVAVPWLVILALAGGGPALYPRLLAAAIGAAVAIRVERSGVRRGKRTGAPLHRTALLCSMPVVAFACGASISVTLAGAVAGLAGVAGITIVLNCLRLQPS